MFADATSALKVFMWFAVMESYFFSSSECNVISVMSKQFEIKWLSSSCYLSVFVSSCCWIRSVLSLSLGVGFLISLTISLHYSSLANADLKRRAVSWQISWVYFWSVSQTVCETLDKFCNFLSLNLLEEIERHQYFISNVIFPYNLQNCDSGK